jgi:hypothetical protein
MIISIIITKNNQIDTLLLSIYIVLYNIGIQNIAENLLLSRGLQRLDYIFSIHRFYYKSCMASQSLIVSCVDCL